MGVLLLSISPLLESEIMKREKMVKSNAVTSNLESRNIEIGDFEMQITPNTETSYLLSKMGERKNNKELTHMWLMLNLMLQDLFLDVYVFLLFDVNFILMSLFSMFTMIFMATLIMNMFLAFGRKEDSWKIKTTFRRKGSTKVLEIGLKVCQSILRSMFLLV